MLITGAKLPVRFRAFPGEPERLESGREASVARGAMDGDAIKSRLDIPTLCQTLAVEECWNGRKWAETGLSGSQLRK